MGVSSEKLIFPLQTHIFPVCPIRGIAGSFATEQHLARDYCLLTYINEFKFDFFHSISWDIITLGLSFILGTSSSHRHASSQLDKFGARRILRRPPPEVRNSFSQVARWRSVSSGNATGDAKKKAGYAKLQLCCNQAVRNGLG